MPTTYTNDGGLGDFIVGQATGVGWNAYSSLGASTRAQPAPIPSLPPLAPPPRHEPMLPDLSRSGTAFAPSIPVRPRGPRYPRFWADAFPMAYQDALVERFDAVAGRLSQRAVRIVVLLAAVAGAILLFALTYGAVHPAIALVGGALGGALAPAAVLLTARLSAYLLGGAISLLCGGVLLATFAAVAVAVLFVVAKIIAALL